MRGRSRQSNSSKEAGKCSTAASATLAARFASTPLLALRAAELLDGRPHGDEGELLQHFEAEVDASVAQLRQLKAANDAAQAAIGEVVAQIAGGHEAFERQRAAVAGELTRLQAEVARHEGEAAAALPELPEGG